MLLSVSFRRQASSVEIQYLNIIQSVPELAAACLPDRCRLSGRLLGGIGAIGGGYLKHRFIQSKIRLFLR